MARRRPPDSDSLELLLDTICNTFGGVLFVTLLIVILVRLSNASSASIQQLDARETTSTIEAQIERQEAELKSLQSALREHRANLSSLEADDTLARARTVISLRRSVEEMAERRADSIAKFAAAADAEAKRQQEVTLLSAEVAQVKAEQSQLTSQLFLERQVRSRTARLPVLHSTLKAELPAILRFGRLYFPYISYEDLLSRTINLDDFLILGDSGALTRVTPKPYAGIEIDTDQHSTQRVSQTLAPIDKASNYLAIAVWEDSFGQFAIVRDTLVRHGIEYRIVPVANDGVVQEADVKESLVQ